MIRECLISEPPKTLHLVYVDAQGKTTERHVEPYEIKESNELYAHCLGADAIRRFKLAQIQSIAPGERFKPRHPIVFDV